MMEEVTFGMIGPRWANGAVIAPAVETALAAYLFEAKVQ
jgi:hypothetical protein